MEIRWRATGNEEKPWRVTLGSCPVFQFYVRSFRELIGRIENHPHLKDMLNSADAKEKETEDLPRA